MKPKSNAFLRASRIALVAITFGALPAFAGTTWDGGGLADTDLGTGANWNVDDLAPAFDGTANVTFSSAGTTATVSPAGNIEFNGITLNQASGFTIQPGTGTLRIKGTSGSSTTNGFISASGSTGMTISAPIVVNTAGTILNVNNSNNAATGLTLSGGLSASSGTYSFRLGGSGKTVISGTVSGVSGIQQSNSSAFSGTVVFDCNLAAAGSLNIASTGSGTVTTPTIQMGTSTSQTQSWTTSTISQNSTIIVNSTATMTTLAIGAAASGGSSGATVAVAGSLSGTTLTVGGAAYTGNLKVSGTASFSGALATGSLAGSKIVGNAASIGTLKLSSGTNLAGSTSTVIGGAGTNENNLNLEKINSGTLTLTGTNPYTGTTTVTAGVLDIGGAILSGTTALSVGATGTLGLSVTTPSTVPGTATFAPGSQVKLTGTAADDALLLTATGGMSGPTPGLNPAVPGYFTKIVGNQLRLKAGTGTLNTWDAGGAADTNINTAANWGGDILPVSVATVIFGDAGSTATVNVDSQFAGVTFNRADAFTIAGSNNLILSSVNSSSSTNLLVTNAAGGTQTIDAPLQVDTTNTTNKFLSIANNSTTQTLDINGSISRSSGSTADYGLRFVNVAGSVTRIDGALNNLTGVQQALSSAAAGDLIFGGNRSSTAFVSIAGNSSGSAPATTARLFLGETPTDTQTWGNLSLSNTIKLVIGGNITAGTISVGGNATAANTLIVGNSATNSTLSLTGGTISNLVTIGGGGTNENNLNLVMAGSGTLNITGGTHTYTGSTAVNSGTLSLATGASLASPIIVNAGATLTGEGATTGSLTFGAGTSTLQFDPGSQLDALTADTVNFSDPSTLVIVNPSAATTPPDAYTVLKRVSGSFVTEDLAKFALTTRSGSFSITGGGKEITLTSAEPTPASLVWKGNDGTNPSSWDLATTLNWDNGGAERFYTGDAVTFDNTASEFNVVVQGTSVSPGDILFDNTIANAYSLSGGSIGGAGSLTKDNTGTVTLANSLSHTGGIVVNAGILDLGTANNTFIGGIDINGGELKFGGAASPATGSLNSQSVTLNGGTITRYSNTTITNDAQTVTINTNGSTLKVDSNATTVWRIGGKVSGAGNWIKSGAGILSLGRFGNTSPANDFTGTITVTAGTLDIRHSDSLGSPASGTSIQNAILLMQNGNQTAGTYTVVEPIDFSGTSFLTGYCQENKTFTQQFNGPLAVADSAVVGISTARNLSTAIAPTLELNASTIVTGTGSVLSFGLRPASYQAGLDAAPQTVNVGSAISGPGAVTVQGDAGSVYTLSAPGYSGNTTVNSGTLKLGAVNANNEVSTVTIESGAKIDIAFSGNDTVATLILGGTNVGPGTYNATTHPAFFDATDTGSIVVPAPAGGYSAWQSANAPGQTVAQDHDNDGVDNGIEYFMGQSGSGFTALPVLNSLNNITWTVGDTYTGTYGTHYVVQTSSDLTTWSPVAIGNVNIDDTAPGKSVSYTLTGAGKRFVRLLVNPN
jgi:autotransporter-associated beta strand protein